MMSYNKTGRSYYICGLLYLKMGNSGKCLQR